MTITLRHSRVDFYSMNNHIGAPPSVVAAYTSDRPLVSGHPGIFQRLYTHLSNHNLSLSVTGRTDSMGNTPITRSHFSVPTTTATAHDNEVSGRRKPRHSTKAKSAHRADEDEEEDELFEDEEDRAAKELDSNAWASRASRIQCCQLLVVIVLTATVAVIAFFLSEDSDTMDRMSRRANSYLDQFDQTHVMGLMGEVRQDYHTLWRPLIIENLARVDNITKYAHTTMLRLEERDLVVEYTRILVEIHTWMDHINHTLMSAALHFNIEL